MLWELSVHLMEPVTSGTDAATSWWQDPLVVATCLSAVAATASAFAAFTSRSALKKTVDAMNTQATATVDQASAAAEQVNVARLTMEAERLRLTSTLINEYSTVFRDMGRHAREQFEMEWGDTINEATVTRINEARQSTTRTKDEDSLVRAADQMVALLNFTERIAVFCAWSILDLNLWIDTVGTNLTRVNTRYQNYIVSAQGKVPTAYVGIGWLSSCVQAKKDGRPFPKPPQGMGTAVERWADRGES